MNKNVIKIMLCIMLIIYVITTPVIIYARDEMIVDPNSYDPGDISQHDIQPITDKIGVIVSALRTVGIVVSVVVLLILGIKYMVGSIEERADYKKSMIPYLVGAIMVFALTQILSIIISVANNLE